MNHFSIEECIKNRDNVCIKTNQQMWLFHHLVSMIVSKPLIGIQICLTALITNEPCFKSVCNGNTGPPSSKFVQVHIQAFGLFCLYWFKAKFTCSAVLTLTQFMWWKKTLNNLHLMNEGQCDFSNAFLHNNMSCPRASAVAKLAGGSPLLFDRRISSWSPDFSFHHLQPHPSLTLRYRVHVLRHFLSALNESFACTEEMCE